MIYNEIKVDKLLLNLFFFYRKLEDKPAIKHNNIFVMNVEIILNTGCCLKLKIVKKNCSNICGTLSNIFQEM